MFQRFPIELVVRTVEHAARDFRFSRAHRQSVVHLASASHSIYAIVAPILYHTLIVTREKASRIRSFMFDDESRAAAARICLYVRVLVHNTGLSCNIDPALFTTLERITALGYIIKNVLEPVDLPQRNSQLHHVNILSLDFAFNIRLLSVRSHAHITHACGFIPAIVTHSEPFSGWERMHVNPAAWIHEVLDELPELTHLGLVLFHVRQPNEVSPRVDLLKLNNLLVALQTALGYGSGRLQQVALRVGGQYIDQRRGDIDDMARQIKDSRFGVWWDERPMSTWGLWNACTTEDAMVAREIWTNARVTS